MNQREPIWWLPLLRRILGWGAAMATLWLAPFPLIYFVFAVVLPVTQWTPALTGFLGLSVLLGFVTGACCAFFAPPTDALNPLKSHVFKAAGLDTAFFFFAVVGGVNVLVRDFIVAPKFNRFVSASALEIGADLILFGLSLWLALNRALHAAKLN